MKRTWLLSLAMATGLVVAWADSAAMAQAWQKDRGYPMQKNSCCQQKGGGEPESSPEPERGAYVAPPRSGVEVGESAGVGVEGPSLHFPALTLKLPSLHLPCLTRFRRAPHMMVESAAAPYVPEVSRAEFSEEASREERAPEGEPESSPESSPEQKGGYSPKQHGVTVPCPTISNGSKASTDFARWQQAQAENAALMQRIAELEVMCQQLESRMTTSPAPQQPLPNAQTYSPPVNPQAPQIAALQQQLAAMQASIERLHQTKQNLTAPQRQVEQVAVYMAGSQLPVRTAAPAPGAAVVRVAPQPDIRRLPAPRPLPPIDPRVSRLPAPNAVR